MIVSPHFLHLSVLCADAETNTSSVNKTAIAGTTTRFKFYLGIGYLRRLGPSTLLLNMYVLRPGSVPTLVWPVKTGRGPGSNVQYLRSLAVNNRKQSGTIVHDENSHEPEFQGVASNSPTVGPGKNDIIGRRDKLLFCGHFRWRGRRRRSFQFGF